MKSDTFYFPHDYHARHDLRLAAFVDKFGMSGYGTWWVLIEIMHEQGGKIKKFPGLMHQLSNETKRPRSAASSNRSAASSNRSAASAPLETILTALIHEFGLLKEDKQYIWSERVLDNLQQRKQKIAQRIEAGRLGGKKSGAKRSKVEAPLQAIEAPLNKSKQRKGKEIKEEEIKENTNTLSAPTKTLAAPGETPCQEFVSKFATLYQRLSGYPYKADRKDYILVTELIKKFSIALVIEKAEMLYRACENRTVWFAKDGYADFTIGKLSQRWNEITPLTAASSEELEAAELLQRQKELEDHDARIDAEINATADVGSVA
jgi:hypothetical protein